MSNLTYVISDIIKDGLYKAEVSRKLLTSGNVLETLEAYNYDFIAENIIYILKRDYNIEL